MLPYLAVTQVRAGRRLGIKYRESISATSNRTNGRRQGRVQRDMAALLVLAAGAATATVPDDKPNIVPPPSPTGSSQGEAKAAKAAPPIATRPLLHLADTPGDTVGLLWNAAQRRTR